ncbi:hypothetical protein MTR67_023746 [Solanum verrucosum]|uniref:Uncharacterized protein n=1 Tax=Solanum verrucosum TaxID=315347 RepID=A0AAF0QVS9_SOLVR|nr:hypothetical protein MTR67_023746 [Solanum verrucosum]
MTPPFLPFYLYFPSGGASYGIIELIVGLVIQSQQLAVGFRPATRRRSLRGHCALPLFLAIERAARIKIIIYNICSHVVRILEAKFPSRLPPCLEMLFMISCSFPPARSLLGI